MIIERFGFPGFLFFWIVAMVLNHQGNIPRINITKQESALNFNQDFLATFSIGQKRLISDFIWIQTLIESDIDHYSGRDLNSWMYLRFKSISRLDPRFYENYLYGGLYLSIVKDDLMGAEYIIDKGLSIFPDDYRLNFQQGYIQAFEKKDFKRALLYYEKIKDSPERAKNFDSFYGKLLNQSVGPEDALHYSIESLKRTPKDTAIYSKIQDNIYSLKAQIDLDCLNSKKTNCSLTDYFGNYYLVKNGVYRSLLTSKKIKLNIRERDGSN
jgi:hypothetical protein